jgi:tetratricopeptide (TPR) repeat protein
MPNPGRNDPCPCGSGKKYKRCCLEQERVAAAARIAAQQAQQLATLAQRRIDIAEDLAAYEESARLDEASNAVIDLIDAGRLDEAEQAARQLLVDYPEVIDGNDRLGMVYEARGQNQDAIACYRKAIELIHAHPGDYDPHLEPSFQKLIAKLDAPTSVPPPPPVARP